MFVSFIFLLFNWQSSDINSVYFHYIFPRICTTTTFLFYHIGIHLTVSIEQLAFHLLSNNNTKPFSILLYYTFFLVINLYEVKSIIMFQSCMHSCNDQLRLDNSIQAVRTCFFSVYDKCILEIKCRFCGNTNVFWEIG